MAIELTERDRRILGEFLDLILEGHKDGTIGQNEARNAVTEAFVLVAKDNANVADYMLETIFEYEGGNHVDRT